MTKFIRHSTLPLLPLLLLVLLLSCFHVTPTHAGAATISITVLDGSFSYCDYNSACDTYCIMKVIVGSSSYSGTTTTIMDNYLPYWGQTFTTPQIASYPGSFQVVADCYEYDTNTADEHIAYSVKTFTSGGTNGASVAYQFPYSQYSTGSDAPVMNFLNIQYKVTCATDYYGATCSTYCTTGSTSNCATCSSSGVCTACKSGYTGTPSCTTCATNYYPNAGSCVYCLANSGGGFYTCNANGTKNCTTGYTGTNCNTLISCGTFPTNPTNAGKITSASSCAANTYNSTCSYSCNSGYTYSSGTNVTTCTTAATWTPITLSCVNINECLTNNGGCNQTCTDSPGSYSCSCLSGYKKSGTGEGVNGCPNINECLTSNGGCQQVCFDTIGSFYCGCNSGYTSNSTTTCRNINECTEGGNNCSPNATCADTVGSFTCTCKAGYSGNGVTCNDIDECLGSPCHQFATCTNTPGNYTCACDAGYSGNGYTDCRAAGSIGFSFNYKLFTLREEGTYVRLEVVSLATVPSTVTFSLSGNATLGSDYTNLNSTTISFTPTDNVKYIVLQILDDGVEETVENIVVTLVSATSASVSSEDYIAVVYIDANDAVAGTVEIDADTRTVAVPSVTSGSVFNLNFTRHSFNPAVGLTHAINVTCKLTFPTQVLFMSATIPVGSNTVSASFPIPNSTIPTLAYTLSVEIYQVQTIGASVSTNVGRFSKSVVSVPDFADPYGVFRIVSTPTRVDEGTNAVFTIHRDAGSFGNVTVHVTSISLDSAQIVGEQQLATLVDDFQSTTTTVVFQESETVKTVTFTTVNDTIPEIDEIFGAQLTIAISSKGRLNDTVSNVAIMIISENDFARGSLNVLTPSSSFDEGEILSNGEAPNNTAVIEVVREKGLFGTISFTWSTVVTTQGNNKDATSGLDYIPVFAQNVTMLPGVDRAFLSVTLLNDNIPELDETFSVVIGNISGGAVINSGSSSTSSAVVTIKASDNPFGWIRFGPADYTNSPLTGENRVLGIEGQSITLSVTRVFGLFGTIAGQAVIKHESTGNDDFVQTTINFTLGPSQSATTVSFTLASNDGDEPVQYFSVELYARSSASWENTTVDQTNSYYWTIPCAIEANNVVNGVLRFNSGIFYVNETTPDGIGAQLVIQRDGTGFVNDIVFTYVAIPGNATAADFDASSDSNSATILAGQPTGIATVGITDDDIPEFNEYFIVYMTSVVSGGAFLSYRSVATVIILANDYPYGLIEFAPSTTNNLGYPDTFVIREGDGVKNIVVNRGYGTTGAVSVDFIVAANATFNPLFSDFLSRSKPSTAASLSTDVTVAASGTLHFAQNVAQAKISLTILDDDAVENDKVFYIGIGNTTGGAELGDLKSVMLILYDNDTAEGTSPVIAAAVGASVGLLFMLLILLILLLVVRRRRRSNKIHIPKENVRSIDHADDSFIEMNRLHSSSVMLTGSGSFSTYDNLRPASGFDVYDQLNGPNKTTYDTVLKGDDQNTYDTLSGVAPPPGYDSANPKLNYVTPFHNNSKAAEANIPSNDSSEIQYANPVEVKAALPTTYTKIA